MIIQYCSLIGGFIIGIGIVIVDYYGMDDDSEEDDCRQRNCHRVGISYDTLLKIGKVTATAIAWVAIQKAGGIFENSADCTDAISATQGFSDIDDAIKTCRTNTIQNWCIEAVMFAVAIYSFYTQRAFNADQALDEASQIDDSDTDTHTDKASDNPPQTLPHPALLDCPLDDLAPAPEFSLVCALGQP